MRQSGRRKGGMQYDILEDCVKRNFRNAGEDDKWGKRSAVRKKWNGIITEAVQLYTY